MALACRPRLLIADEPTTALDVTIQAQILALLDELQAEMGMALLFITHDLNLVRRFTHRVGVMERGKLVESGPTAAVFAAPQHRYTQSCWPAGRCARSSRSPADAPVLVDGARRARQLRACRGGWFAQAPLRRRAARDARACAAARRSASSANRARARRRSAWPCSRCSRSPPARSTLDGARVDGADRERRCARCGAASRSSSRIRSARSARA